MIDSECFGMKWLDSIGYVAVTSEIIGGGMHTNCMHISIVVSANHLTVAVAIHD